MLATSSSSGDAAWNKGGCDGVEGEGWLKPRKASSMFAMTQN